MKKESKKDLTFVATQMHIVVLAVQMLGGDSRSVDTEDIAMEAHKLAPDMFAWRKYPEQINLELIRVALSDAKKEKYGSLLTGSGRQGWSLTPRGVKWIAGNAERLRDGKLRVDVTRRSAGSVDVVRKKQEHRRLVMTEAWRKWTEDITLDSADVKWLFRIDSFSSDAQKLRKVTRLMALFSDDPEVIEFLSHAQALLDDGEEES